MHLERNHTREMTFAIADLIGPQATQKALEEYPEITSYDDYRHWLWNQPDYQFEIAIAVAAYIMKGTN